MFYSYSILHALNTCAGRRVGRTSFWRHCGTVTRVKKVIQRRGVDQRVATSQSPARVGGGISAGRDRLGRVAPANAMVDACGCCVYGVFLGFLRKTSAINIYR